MAARAPGWFEAVKSPNGWTYTLNPADREPVPWPAWFRWFLGAGAIALIVAGVGILGWFVATASSSGWDADRVGPGLVALVFLAAGAGLAIGQLRRRAGRCELGLDAGAIRAIWRLGPISWSKTVRRSDAAQLAVVRRSFFLDASPIGGGPGDYHVLVAEDATGRRRDLVANYPREILLALAVDLSSRWKVPDIDPDVDGVGAGKLAVVEDTEVPTDIRERRDLPLGSRLICERVGGRGVRIAKPPDGLAQGAGCLIFMGGFGVTALVLVVTLLMQLLLYWSGDDLRIARILTYGGIGLGALWCAFTLVVAVGVSTGRFVLTATPDRLTLEKGDAVWGTSCRSWKKQDIAWICAETTIESPGGSESGPVVTTHVLIRTKGPIESKPEELEWGSGKGISKPEMEWIATTLRAVLGVPAGDAPTGNAIRAGSGEPRGRHRCR
jgi:hypothetical protein